MVAGGVVVLLALVGSVAFFLGDKHALDAMRVTHATPDQIAVAMQQDQFFADYRERALVVTGTVASVIGDAGGEVVHFRSASQYAALCDLRDRASGVRPGMRLTVIAEGATGERQSSAVMLRNCRLP